MTVFAMGGLERYADAARLGAQCRQIEAARLQVMIERRLPRSAQRATGAARIEYMITKPKPEMKPITLSDKW